MSIPFNSLYHIPDALWKALPLFEKSLEQGIDLRAVYNRIEQKVKEEADQAAIMCFRDESDDESYDEAMNLSDDTIYYLIKHVWSSGIGEWCDQPKSLLRGKARIPTHITALNKGSSKLRGDGKHFL